MKVNANDAMHTRALHLTTQADLMSKRLHEESAKNYNLEPNHPNFYPMLHEAVAMHPEWSDYLVLNRKATQARLIAKRQHNVSM